MFSRQLGRGIAFAMATAGAGLTLAQPAFAQQPLPSSTDLDPSAPLDPLPDLEVDWPDMEAADPVLPPSDAPGDVAPAPPPSEIDDSAAAQRYSVVLAGLDQIADEDLLKAFRGQSALEDG